MNVMLFILPIFAIGFTLIPLVPIFTALRSKSVVKNLFLLHICVFFGILISLTIFTILTGIAHAKETAEAAKAGAQMADSGLKYIAAALATGISSVGAGVAVGGSAPAAIGAYSENPDTFTKAMIFVVLGEGVAIYGFVISFMIMFV